MITAQVSNEFRNLLNTMSDDEFNKFLNNSLKASGKKCIRIERDSLSYTIASASIIAKCHRDDSMIDFAKMYSNYGFEQLFVNVNNTVVHIEIAHRYNV